MQIDGGIPAEEIDTWDAAKKEKKEEASELSITLGELVSKALCIVPS